MTVLPSLSSLLYSYLLYRNGLYISPLLIKYSWQGCIMYSTMYTSVHTIPLFIIPLFTIQKPIVLSFTIQKPIVLSFTIQKSSWQGILLYSTLYTSAPAIQQFTVPLFTIQEWTSFTPGRVYSCIVPYAVLPQPLSSLLYSNLLLIKYSWQGILLYSTLYTSAPAIQQFTIQLFTIQKPIVLSFTIQKSSWQGCIMYSTMYTSVHTIPLFIIPLFTIQRLP